MAGSRYKKTQEIHKAVLRPLLLEVVNGSQFCSVFVDDSATMEQLGVHVRYKEWQIEEKSLPLLLFGLL